MLPSMISDESNIINFPVWRQYGLVSYHVSNFGISIRNPHNIYCVLGKTKMKQSHIAEGWVRELFWTPIVFGREFLLKMPDKDTTNKVVQ